MADTKLSALASNSPVELGNELVVNDSAVSKRIRVADLKTLFQELGMPRVARLDNQHSIASTTGTEVLELAMVLEPGTFTFTYALLVRSTSAGVGPMLGVNFTGTGSPRQHFRFMDDSVGLLAEVHEMDNQGSKDFGFVSGMADNTESTAAPAMGTTVGVSTTGTDMLCWIEGIIIVTAQGELELWHSSETATATSVEVGSSLIVTRTA